MEINQHYFSVKTILYPFALSLALCAAHGATAQTRSTTSAPKTDSVMLSETTYGDYLVRKYEVRSNADAGYELYYPISNSNLSSSFDGNARSMERLNDFLTSIDRDSLMSVHSITITGYASPDGPLALNQRLARGRAQSLKAYVDRKYRLSQKYDVRINSQALGWDAARAAVAAANFSDRQNVLNIIDQRQDRTATESRLKAMPTVWTYLADNILPSLRYADISIEYTDRRIVERRTLIPQPEVVIVEEEEEVCDPCACIDVEAAINGLIVEMPDVPVDF